MLTIRSVIITDDSSSGLVANSKKSMRLSLGSDAEIAECRWEELAALIDGSDLIHVVAAGTVVLPGFYSALMTGIEHTRRDYVFCGCLNLEGDDGVVVHPEDDNFHVGQMVVRTWVLKELDYKSGGNLKKRYRRVVSEYRGHKVPHVLCVVARQGDT